MKMMKNDLEILWELLTNAYLKRENGWEATSGRVVFHVLPDSLILIYIQMRNQPTDLYAYI